jgi:hypothetical protein
LPAEAARTDRYGAAEFGAVTYPPHQQYHGQSGYGDGIALTLKWFPLTFIFALTKPVVTIDGHPVQVPWSKRTVIPVAPGQHHLHVHVPYFLPSRVGPADLPVMVGGGRPVELEYRAPAWAFSPGSLGPPPQRYNGMIWQLIPLAIIALVVVGCCGAAILSTLADST